MGFDPAPEEETFNEMRLHGSKLFHQNTVHSKYMNHTGIVLISNSLDRQVETTTTHARRHKDARNYDG